MSDVAALTIDPTHWYGITVDTENGQSQIGAARGYMFLTSLMLFAVIRKFTIVEIRDVTGLPSLSRVGEQTHVILQRKYLVHWQALHDDDPAVCKLAEPYQD